MTNCYPIIARILVSAHILLLFSANTFGQFDAKKCKKLISEDYTNENFSPKDLLKTVRNDTLLLIKCLSNTLTDSLSYDISHAMINKIKTLTSKSKNEITLKATLKYYIKFLSNHNSGLAALVLRELRLYPRTLYDSIDIQNISKSINSQFKAYKDIVLLAGYIGHPIFTETINQVFPNSRAFNKQERWATHIALARIGDESALNYCTSRSQSLALSDQVIDIIYPDLIYTHKKQAYDILVKAIYSDEKKCSSLNPNSNSRIICGYRIVELLAPKIKNFPIKVLPSGDLDVSNYQAAIEIAREWFKINLENYEIIDNAY